MADVERIDLVTGAVQSGGRPPAECDLRLVQDFVNTLDREHGNDLLDGPDGLAAWLEHRGFEAGGLGPAAVPRAVEVREALRALLLANNGGPGAPEAHAVLEAAARRARLEPAFGPARLVPAAGGLDGALGRVLAVAFAAMLDGRWARLKACPRDACGWVFLDRSHANRGTWCSMRICGNRVKAGAYYRRRTRAA
jgi:predicted RNA-binding Zn ribbon-like protein